MIWNAINEQVKTGERNNIFDYTDDIILKYCFLHTAIRIIIYAPKITLHITQCSITLLLSSLYVNVASVYVSGLLVRVIA